VALKKIYFGSLGPYLYDDNDDIDDPDGDFAGESYKSVMTDGQLKVSETPTENTHVLRKEDLDDMEGLVPSGAIILWSGAVVDIPDGWALCDGSGDTPDLRGSFVLGAGGSYDPDDDGGNSIGDLESYSLSSTNMPAHSHSISSDGSHSGHSYSDQAIGAEASTASMGNATAGAHDHGGSTGTEGSGNSFDVAPPYYALAYIMKTAY